MNKAIIIGNLGADPERQTTQAGKIFARLSVATSVSWKDKTTGEKKEKTEWHRVVVWSEGTAKFLLEHAKKGGKVAVEGKISTHDYEKNGVKHYSTEIVVQGPDTSVRLIGKPTSAATEPEGRFDGGGGSGDYEAGAFF